MTALHTTTLSLSEQAAREAVAREWDRADATKSERRFAAKIRDGQSDKTVAAYALTGARAAHAAVMEAVVRACAGVAQRRIGECGSVSSGKKDRTEMAIWTGRQSEALTIQGAILALLEKDTTT